MASSPVTAPSAPSEDSSPPPPTSSTNSSSSTSPPPSSSPTPPSSPPPSPPTSPPPAPPTSPPPAPPTSSPPPARETSPPPTVSSPPPTESASPPPPAESRSPVPNASPSRPPPNSPLVSPPPTSTTPPSTTPSPPSPSTTVPNAPSGSSPTSPSATFSPPPPTTASSLSPPPPSRTPAHRSPGSSNGSSGSQNSPPSNSSSTNVALIAGITVAGVVVLAFIIICLTCQRKKKKQPYYMEPGRGPRGGEYYNGSTQWHSPQPTDHVVKLPPPPGVPGPPMGSGGGWAGTPAVHTSSEFSSGFSGPHHTPNMPPSSPNMALGFSKSQFSYDELASATGGFAQANLLGQGGFGYVHKGVLPDGKEVAVKSLKSGSGQGEREFQAEVEIISRVHHRHLVSLVGYCIADGQRMLVYEFVSNKTLEFHLHGKGQPVMDWATRIRIAVGSAKGLAYLHEDCHPRIIHRDIKAANILLDDNYEAMVADFGLAKLSSDNYTHVSTRVMGTFGYLAPEYASSGKLSDKSDVFSFGVMLLELITGRPPVDLTGKFMEDSLVDWARPLLTEAVADNNYDELVDPRLEGNYAPLEMVRMVACAAASIRHSARRRPKMSQIVRALDGDASLDDLSEVVKPGQSSVHNSNVTAEQSYDTGAYNADMMKFRKMVMSSQEFASSEYGGTSEYGLNPSASSSDSKEMGHSGLNRQKL